MKEDDEEDRYYRYRGIGYVKRVQKLKKNYIKQHEALTGEIQEGLSIHLDFHYLLNTDFNWIVKTIRDSILEALNEECRRIYDKNSIDNELKERLNDYLEKRRRTILTLNIEQVSTGKSIDFLFTPGIIDTELIEMVKILGLNIASILIYETFKKLKNKNIGISSRFNIKGATCTRTEFIRHPDGTIEYIEEKDEFEFE